MTEKEMFIQTWEREFQTTLKVLKAYPATKLDLKPHERSRSAREFRKKISTRPSSSWLRRNRWEMCVAVIFCR